MTTMAQKLAATMGVEPPFKSGWYYTAKTNQTTGAVTQNVLSAEPLFNPAPCVASAIGVGINANVASALVRLGIFLDNGFGYPGAELLEAPGTIDASSGAGTWKEIAINQLLPAGLLHLVGVSQGAAANLYQSSGVGTSSAPRAWAMPTNGVFGNNPQFFTQAGVSGALPANFSATIALATTAIRVGIKIA